MSSSAGKHRASVSLSLGCYTRLKEYSERESVAMSALIERLTNKFLNTQRVQVKHGYQNAGQQGERLGADVVVQGMSWTPVLWDEEEDPSWFKTKGLEDHRGGIG